ncbi:MAG: YciI family protein [Phenylobacterium sp.]|uniref:YciI family protein n=1 Tax=Phenylobacterium sp. TaxID=1871053 RepID=UPI001200FE76|nr:YciI family protein [Phenylobacterium sp.]TAJ71378.1 MAG: YciI family protein [Phenylobacterium sp.]
MPTFVLHCLDKADSLDLRMATRERHLAYVKSRAADVKVAGPMFDDAGGMAGSMFILDVVDKAAARAFSDADPYTQAGLWRQVELNAVKVTFGQL